MSRTVLLDNTRHKDLKVRTGFSSEFGDNVNMALVFPSEFSWVQREYPILFRKDEREGLQAVALLGLDRGENLFLDGQEWRARYVPAVHQRGPFLIGLHDSGSGQPEPMVHVDLDHPRISETEGQPVFLRHGGHSPYLERINRVLQLIVQGADAVAPMFTAFGEAGLLETMEVKVNLDERTQYTLPEFLTIDTERLAALKGAELERLNRSGFLNLAFAAAGSLGNIEWLIELKNRKRAAEAG